MEAADELSLPDTIGGLVRYARDQHRGWSQKRLSEETARVGLGPAIRKERIMRIEGGKKPRPREMLILSAALRVSPKALGATAEDYPELAAVGWDPSKLIERIRCYGKPRPYLRLVTPTLTPSK